MNLETSYIVRLREDLASLFMAAVEAKRTRLQQGRIHPVVATSQTIIEPDFQGSGSMQTATVSLPRNALAVDGLATKIDPWPTTAEVEKISDCEARLADSAQGTLPFWSVFAPQLSSLIVSPANGDPRRPGPAVDLHGRVVASISSSCLSVARHEANSSTQHSQLQADRRSLSGIIASLD